MKIAYITEVNITADTGVKKKTQQQVASWVALGNDVTIYSFAGVDYSGGKKVNIDQHFNVKIYTHKLPLLSNSQNNFLNKIISGYQFKRDIQSFSPDIIYYRQGMWFPALTTVMKRFPTIMEVNTLDSEEYKHAPLLKKRIYSMGRKKILQNLKGIVYTAYELRKAYRKYHLQDIVVSNGIELSMDDKDLMTRREVKERPQLIYVSSPGMIWNGLDKVQDMALHLPEFDFHLVGEKIAHTGLASNIYTYGYLGSDELSRMYNFIDVGIGTLALHRKGLEEASPLKVREYCKFGIACIGAYKDPDLDGKDFMLRLENKEDNIIPNLKKIHDFVWKWHGKRIHVASLRDILDSSVKESSRINFFKQIIANT